jgi:hypothetical protein
MKFNGITGPLLGVRGSSSGDARNLTSATLPCILTCATAGGKAVGGTDSVSNACYIPGQS